MNSWTLCLLIGSFVPIQRTLVTCDGPAVVVQCPTLPKGLKLGPGTSAEVGRAKNIAIRVMDRLQQAEAHESEPYYQQHIRQAWIVVSLLQKGYPDAFVRSSYSIYGKHPDLIWPSIVADRKSRLGSEYHTWYTADDVLRPDIPQIPPRNADTHAANEASFANWDGLAGLVPTERKLV